MKSYDHKKIEKKWQKIWDEGSVNKAEDASPKPKAYILDMFPYPSGAGLHVGHVEGYTATDIYARYKRMQGFNVLHPMGWDAFGLPAENYAIKTKVHPDETTSAAINTFRTQIKSLGLSYDWSREIGTHTPEYYRWTQWFFLTLYKNGLAYKKKGKVNWCSKDQTVLANEQVVDGKCERCGTVVEQKDLEQWYFGITKYAEDLIAGLDTVDWPESTKAAQKNWIGKSEGAEIDFAIKNSELKITVFTTRADTLFGATYLVLAPEHAMVAALHESITNWNDVENYIASTKKKTDLDRQEQIKDKTGVRLEGVLAINPANNEEIPVYIADYVLPQYGTGAIMAVPAHDERDFAFAEKFNLRMVEVISGLDTANGVIDIGDMVDRNQELRHVVRPISNNPFTGLFGFLINSGDFSGMSIENARPLIVEKFGKLKTTYKLRDWLVSRQRYWGAPIPIIYCDDCGAVPVPEKDLPVLLPRDVDFMPTGESPLKRSESFQHVSCPTCGKAARRESDTLDTFVCSSWYYFRFADPHNTEVFASKELIKQWLPVDLYMGGAEHTVLHLLYARFFTKVLQTLGYISFDEPFLKLRHQGTILAEDGRKMSKSLGNVINPDDVVSVYGADSLRVYEMFMGPIEQSKPWNTNSIIGSRRFLDRVWGLYERVADVPLEGELEILLNQTVKKVTEDIEALKFNTAISALMILLNAIPAKGDVPRALYEMLLKVLAPIAPHITEELWNIIGHTTAIHVESWPSFDASKITQSTVTIGIQINGKTRGDVQVASGADKDTLEESARAVVAKYLEGKSVVRVVVVPNRLVNFVVSD